MWRFLCFKISPYLLEEGLTKVVLGRRKGLKFGPVMQEVVTAMSEKRFLILPHAEVLPAEEPFSWRVGGRSEMEFLFFFWGGLPSFFLGDR